MINKRVKTGVAVLLCGAALGAAQAQAPASYPQRSVTVIVPFTPGTSADVISRVLGPQLSEKIKVSVVTENRPGAGGNLGAEIVA